VWQAAGRRVTLEEIEHRILRPEFGDARIDFAVNCASVTLDAAGRRYLASSEGLQVDGEILDVSSIFKWYGDDFIGQYASLLPGTRPPRERAILGAIATFGPAPASALAMTGRVRIRYLDYDWSLNDIAR
jgi:hypothetical protein